MTKPISSGSDHETVKPRLVLVDGRPMTTSLIVAEHFDMRHDNVLQAIRLLECSERFHRLNFQELIEYVEVGKGARRPRPVFRITRDGFAFLAMGFTGARAARWKEAYIDAFNRMEQALRRQPVPMAAVPVPTKNPPDELLLQLFLGLGMKRGETAVIWFISQRRDHEDDNVCGSAALIALASQGFVAKSTVQRARKLLAERGDITFEVIPRFGGCYTLDDATLRRILTQGAIEMADLRRLIPLGPPARIPESVRRLMQAVTFEATREPLPEETLAILDLTKKLH